MNPSKVKEVVLETAEDDIEEIPHLPGLPNVNQRDEPGDVMMGKKSAFTESSSLSSETEEEFSLETSDLINQQPPSSRSGHPPLPQHGAQDHHPQAAWLHQQRG